MNGKTYLYILVCAAVSFLIRELPLTLIRRPIRNRFLRSFLFYVPYVTLAVMTFPSILHTTSSPIAGLAALVLGIAAAWLGANLLQVAVGCCAIVALVVSSLAASLSRIACNSSLIPAISVSRPGIVMIVAFSSVSS